MKLWITNLLMDKRVDSDYGTSTTTCMSVIYTRWCEKEEEATGHAVAIAIKNHKDFKISSLQTTELEGYEPCKTGTETPSS